MISNLQSLTRPELEALPRDQTLFFFSLGPIEDHGPYLPVGLDTETALNTSKLICEKLQTQNKNLNFVLMPPIHLGLDSNTSEFSLPVRPYVLRDYLVDTCMGLSRRGFRWFMVVSGHLGPKQLTAIEEAGKLLNRGWPIARTQKRWLISLGSLWVSRESAWQSPLWSDPSEHASAQDAAFATLFNVEGANLAALSKLPAMERRGGFLSRALTKWSGKTSGYWGDPAAMNLREEKARLDHQVNVACEYVRNALTADESRKPFKRAQSPYHWFPPNRTFFKAWFIFILIMMMMLIWFNFFMDFLGF